MDTQNVQPWQLDFLERATALDESAETSSNPEAALEWAGTLRERSHTGVDTVEELDDESEQQEQDRERPANTFMLGTRFSDMEQQELEPIWPGWIYSGVITGIIGEEGTGKSTLMTALAARISSGRNGPDGGRTRKGTVLYIGPEEFDDITILDRLNTEEAITRNVISLRDIFDEDFKLPTHIDDLKRAIVHYKASLVVIDPINSVVARGHTLNTNQGARAILGPLQKMLREAACGMVFITHFTKMSKTQKASTRASGSQGIYDFLRVYCTLSIDQPTGKVILHQTKNNLLTRNATRPPDLSIEKLSSGRLFFSGVGTTPDFRIVTENQMLSMGQQAILRIVDSDPLYDFPAGMIHQCLLEIYPTFKEVRTRSLLSRMSGPDSKGHIHICKLGWGYYCSMKRADILAEQAKQATPEVMLVAEDSAPTESHVDVELA